MFDSGHCHTMKSGALSCASVSALRAVHELLIPSAERIEADVTQAQHLFRDSVGADTDDIPLQSPTGRVVPSAAGPHPQLSQDAYQWMLRLSAQMMDEHLKKVRVPVQPEASDE